MTRYYSSENILLADGVKYGFHVTDAKEGDEFNGKPTMVLTLRVTNEDNEFTNKVIEFRFFTFMINKLCGVLGFERKNDAGRFYFDADPRDFIAKEFECVNRHQLSKDKTKTFNQLDISTMASEDDTPF